jgi:hypothetical protein
VLAAGDIASCTSTGDELTARLLAETPGLVLALGDNAYPTGSSHDYRRCYSDSWGPFKDRTRPTPGNHEYDTPGASGYFAYFGRRAGPPGRGYYSFDLGAWHIVSLDSNCWAVGGCGPGSPQDLWLQRDLQAHPTRCTLAYWHHPRWSSGTVHGSDPDVQQLWSDLYAAGAELVLSGHEHSFERFAPQDAAGRADRAGGIREFVVGTGGADLYPFGAPVANSQVRFDDTIGILRLNLSPTGYRWTFLPAAYGSSTDSGTGRCH